MKCLETEKLVGYAYRLMDESEAAQVRAHLGECPRCCEIVEQHGRLHAVLDAWQGVEPTPAFDARVRQAVEAQQARRQAWGFWGWRWARGMALASVGILIIAGLAWFTHSHVSGARAPQVATRQPQPSTAAPVPAPAESADLHSPPPPVRAVKRAAQVAPKGRSAAVAVTEDRDAQALEDYDLAANFDLLSELPKAEQRIRN